MLKLFQCFDKHCSNSCWSKRKSFNIRRGLNQKAEVMHYNMAVLLNQWYVRPKTTFSTELLCSKYAERRCPSVSICKSSDVNTVLRQNLPIVRSERPRLWYGRWEMFPEPSIHRKDINRPIKTNISRVIQRTVCCS